MVKFTVTVDFQGKSYQTNVISKQGYSTGRNPPTSHILK